MNSFGEYLWQLPFDWLAVKERELREILEIVEVAENTRLDEAARQRHEAIYYFEVYLRRHFEDVRSEVARKPSHRNDDRELKLHQMVNDQNTRYQKLKDLADDGKHRLS